MTTTNPEGESSAAPGLAPPDPYEVGAVLSEKFMIERRLGGGGMGTVYAAINFVVNRRVAIKVMHAWVAESPELVGRFRTEARAAATIGHPNIVEVFDMGQTDDGLPYVVMEYLEGEDLFERLARSGRLEAGEAACVARQILAAIEAAHRLGIIHCDLKPENVFLANHPSGRAVAKILDFGVARVAADCGVEPAGAGDSLVVGTPAYMSPEQAAGRALDHRTDVYSVGVIVYEMLSGVVPYDGEERDVLDAIQEGPPPSLGAIAPSVDPALARVVDRAMARRPSDRYASAAAFAAALAPFEEELVERSAPVPLVRLKRRSGDAIALPMSFRPLRWVAGAAIVAVALLAWVGPLRPYVEHARREVGRVLAASGLGVEGVSAASPPRPPTPPVARGPGMLVTRPARSASAVVGGPETRDDPASSEAPRSGHGRATSRRPRSRTRLPRQYAPSAAPAWVPAPVLPWSPIPSSPYRP